MRTDDQLARAGGGAAISRRTLLSSGAGALAAAYSLDAIPAWAVRRRARRIDEAAIRRMFAQTARSLITPGAFMLLRAPGVELSAAYGTGVLGEQRDLGPGDRFRIGSVTKTFTGTVILQAVQRGALQLDDPVSRFRPDVPNGKHVTIDQLLSMRSGLYNYTQSRALNRTMDRQPRHVVRPRDILRIAYAARPHPVPAQRFEYCNTNTILLGLIAEQLYGRPLAAIFQHHLFGPLGMDRSSMPGLRAIGIPNPHPRGYMFGTNVSTLPTEELPPRQRAAAEAGRLKPHDVTVMNPSWAGAAGAGISTAEDLARLAKGICDGSLLNRRWQRRRLDSIRSVDPSNPHASGYGLAIAKRGAVYGHGGSIPGFQSFIGYDPARKLTLVVWTNLKASPRGLPCAQTIAERLLGRLYA
jgi:D-alanyl-D-alanine carboxypeptidase